MLELILSPEVQKEIDFEKKLYLRDWPILEVISGATICAVGLAHSHQMNAPTNIGNAFSGTFFFCHGLVQLLKGEPFAYPVNSIEKALRGDNSSVEKKLEFGIPKLGDAFYVEGEVPGVIVKTRITSVDDKGFDYKGKFVSGRHIYGSNLNDYGILRKNAEVYAQKT